MLDKLFNTLKGSSLSGNYGHIGRKGQRGGSASSVSIGSMLGKGNSEYANDATLTFSKLNGIRVPRLKEDEVYLVRYSTNNESEGVGQSAYAGRELDDLIESASAYKKGTGGYIHISRSKDDDYREGEEIAGIMGTKWSPLNLVIDVSNGNVVYQSNEDPK